MGLKVRPRKGQALVFYSLKPDGNFDPQSLHGGCPVVKGEKWVATKWIRQRCAQNRSSGENRCLPPGEPQRAPHLHLVNAKHLLVTASINLAAARMPGVLIKAPASDMCL